MYKDNLRCSWTITVSRGRAAIRFTSIDIQGHSTCAYDYLAVYDGANSSGTQLGKFCGKTIPPPVVASGKTRHLVFISDSSVNGQGFSIEYVGVTNLARGRSTAQSSTAYNLPSSNAVDGITDGILWHYSCTHTHTQSNPWWRVDLGSTRTIFTVDVYNRVDDCDCSDRLNPFYVHVGHSTSVTSNPSCGGQQSVSEDYKSVPCNGLQGRYVGVALQGNNRILTLCEVKVFGV
ncbi:fucolectin-like [Branchiostoma floridae x Branchiostoma belcheri]